MQGNLASAMTSNGPGPQDPPSIDASLARLQQLRVRAEELVGGRTPVRREVPVVCDEQLVVEYYAR